MSRSRAAAAGGARRLVADQSGTSFIELALVAPVLVLFIVGIIDLAQGLSVRFTLQQAVDRGLELVQSGPAQARSTSADVDYSYVVDETAQAADVPTSAVLLQRWLECDDVVKPDYSATCAQGEDTRRYLRLEVEKPSGAALWFRNGPIKVEAALRIQ